MRSRLGPGETLTSWLEWRATLAVVHCVGHVRFPKSADRYFRTGLNGTSDHIWGFIFSIQFQQSCDDETALGLRVGIWLAWGASVNLHKHQRHGLRNNSLKVRPRHL